MGQRKSTEIFGWNIGSNIWHESEQDYLFKYSRTATVWPIQSAVVSGEGRFCTLIWVNMHWLSIFCTELANILSVCFGISGLKSRQTIFMLLLNAATMFCCVVLEMNLWTTKCNFTSAWVDNDWIKFFRWMYPLIILLKPEKKVNESLKSETKQFVFWQILVVQPKQLAES